MKKLLLIALALTLAGCAGIEARQGGEVTLPPGGDVLVACATCEPCPTDTPTPTAEPTLGPAGRDHLVPDAVTTVDGAGNYSQVEPGDRLLIPATRTAHLKFVNLRGELDRPIVIMNHGGQVALDDGHWVGMEFQNSEWFRLTGTGTPGIEYGFVLRDFWNAGIFARRASRNFEVDHVEISGLSMAGMRSSTFTTEVSEGWIQTGTHIHHTYVHDVNGEAFYIGHRVDKGRAPLEGLEMSHNRVERAGTDGLQMRQAYNCDIHDNYIHSTGVRLEEMKETRPLQGGAGLIIGSDCTGRWYSNIIINANRGIQLQSEMDDVRIYNNLLVDSGQIHGGLRNEGGIRWFGDGGAQIFNNTVVNSYSYGIRGSPDRGVVYNNLVAGPDWLCHIRVGDAEIYNNIEADTVGEIGFVSPAAGDYRLAAGSVAVDAGGEPCPAFDLDGRLRGAVCDVGAFEGDEP